MMITEFRFIEYNPRRAARGAEAARVAVIEDGDEQWIWMSKRDISKNMMAFGRCDELTKAHQAYAAEPTQKELHNGSSHPAHRAKGLSRLVREPHGAVVLGLAVGKVNS